MRKHVLQDGKGQKKGSKDKEVKKNQRWMFFFNILYETVALRSNQ